MVRKDNPYKDELVRLLKIFSEAFDIEVNWGKSCAYWFDTTRTSQSGSQDTTSNEAHEGYLSKLLGTHFGLNLHMLINSFTQKFPKKLII